MGNINGTDISADGNTNNNTITKYKSMNGTGTNKFYDKIHQYTTSNKSWSGDKTVSVNFWNGNHCKSSSNSVADNKNANNYPSQSYYNCSGYLHTTGGKKVQSSINTQFNNILKSYKLLIVGSPCIGFELETIRYKNKKSYDINVSYEHNRFYDKKIIIEDHSQYNLNSILTHNCFIFFKSGTNLYTNNPINPLIKRITPYDRTYSNIRLNSANLFTTLISLKIIDQIKKNNKDFNDENFTYSYVTYLLSELYIKIFKKQSVIKNNIPQYRLIRNIIFTNSYIQYLYYEGSDPILLNTKYFVVNLIKLEIKEVFLFNLLFKFDPDYFTPTNMDHYYSFVYDYFLEHNNDKNISASIKSHFKNIKIHSKIFDKIINSWFTFIDIINDNRNLFSVPDAPVFLSFDNLSDDCLNKCKYIRTYTDLTRLKNAERLFVTVPCSFNSNRLYNLLNDIKGKVEKPKNNINDQTRKENYYEQIELLKYFNIERVFNNDKENNDKENNCNCLDNHIYLNNKNSNIVIFNDSKYYLIPNLYAKFLNEIDYSHYHIGHITIGNNKLVFNELNVSEYKYLFADLKLKIIAGNDFYTIIKNPKKNKTTFVRTNELINIDVKNKNQIQILDIFSKITYTINFVCKN